MIYKIIFICFLFLNANIAKAISSLTASIDEWYPYTTSTNKDYGTASKIITKAFASQGIKVNIEFTAWKRTLFEVENGQADFSYPWHKNPDREKIYIFSNPILEVKNAFFYKMPKQDIFENYKSIAELKNYKFGVTNSYAYSIEFTNLINNNIITPEVAYKDIHSLNKILAGRIDLFPCSVMVCQNLIKNNFTQEEQAMITHSKQNISQEALHLIISKNHPRALEIINIFNKGLEKISK